MYQKLSLEELYALYLKHPVVTTDTRDCPAGSLFFALKGANFNGNDFAAKALENGCAYAVVDEERAAVDERTILTDNVLRTMQQLATLHRQTLALPVLQITGTNGKTTTKELTSAVLAQKYNVLFTQGNFNNDIGVPKTLLRLTSENNFAVIETGANHPGEIKTLTNIVQPDLGLITNVGKAHLEGFGSFEGVIRTKGELYDFLRTQADGKIFLHADDEHLSAIATGLTTITYGVPGKGYAVEGELLDCSPFLRFRWRAGNGNWQTVTTHLIGSYNLPNALAAATVGTYFGISAEKVTEALTNYQPTNNRSELKETAHNHLIVDAYNANPTSMAAALENFKLMKADHKMAILGDMRELGASSDEEHQKVVDTVKTTGSEEIWLVGENFEKTAHTGCRTFKNVDEVKEALHQTPVSGRTILIKGSNGTKLFQLPEEL